MSDSLFQDKPENAYQPLASRMRPQRLEEFIGQQHILAPGKPLYQAIDQQSLHSMILWGPPGVGKTTLARLVAHACDCHFESISAVLAGVKEIRETIERARFNQTSSDKLTVMFVDEVHRFNKSQQDAFLPHIENGTIIFIGATTENPSFELNNALLSRARVYLLKSLNVDELQTIIKLSLSSPQGLAESGLKVSPGQQALLAKAADGDARRCLNLLEILSDMAQPDKLGSLNVSDDLVLQIIQEGSKRFDKGGDLFYHQISALHKSVRGSSPDGALYWLCRMLDGGCDPIYIARRLVRMASEDIGNADPRALEICLNCWDTYTRLGSPEGELAIAQATVYLACAPKSNAVYTAFNKTRQLIQNTGSLEVPLHLRNAVTALSKQIGEGEEYRYAHDENHGYAAGENYLPQELQDEQFYTPVKSGLESKIRDKLDYFRSLDAASSQQRYKTD